MHEVCGAGAFCCLQVNNRAAIIQQIIRPAFALEASLGILPEQTGFRLARQAKQTIGSRVVEHAFADLADQIGVLTADHGACASSRREHIPFGLACIGAAVDASRGYRVVGVPFIRLEHAGVNG